MDKQALVTALALNYPITGRQASDILDVLGVIAQYSLQNGGQVELPGIGTISVNESSEVLLSPSKELLEVVANPDIEVSLDHIKGTTSGELYMGDATIYKHKVNVC